MTHKQVIPAAISGYLGPRATEEGDCLLWNLARNSEGVPVASIEGIRSRPVRRWVWETIHGPAGSRRIIPSCGNPSCVAPSHCIALSPSGVNLAIAKRGGYRSAAFRRAAQKRGRSTSPLDLPAVREIRRLRWAEGQRLSRIREAFPDVSISVLSRICRGESWHDPADPWAGLREKKRP